MDCTHTRSLVHGYIDRELDPESVIAVDMHLRNCMRCRQIYDQYLSLQSTVRKQASYFTAPPVLADRVRANLGLAAHAPARAVRPRSKWFHFDQWLQFGTAIATTAAVTWVVALQLNGPSQDEAISEQVIAGYARSVLTSHITDVATSDQHTVKPWLSGRLDFSPPVMDLATKGFPLVGGRLDYLDNRPVATLVYRYRQHLINLYVWPYAKSGNSVAMQTLSKHGYYLLHWVDAGMTYWAISDVDPADLKIFAETYASSK